MMVDFPKDLLHKILVMLPIGTLLCLRSVCKEWYFLVEDPQFQKTWASFHMQGGEHITFYHGFMEHVFKYLKMKDRQFWINYRLFVDGFVILQTRSGHDSELYVIDPANAYLKEIPYPDLGLNDRPRAFRTLNDIRDNSKACGMVVSPDRKSYSIFVESKVYENRGQDTHSYFDSEEKICIHQYDSTRDSWSVACKIPTLAMEETSSVQNVAVHRGSLYFLIESATLGSEYEDEDEVGLHFIGVRHFDKDSHCWEDLFEGFPKQVRCPSSHLEAFLFEYSGKLLLGAVYNARYNIWQYDDEEAQWSLLDSFPKEPIDNMSLETSRWGTGLSAQHHGDFFVFDKIWI